MKSYKLVNSKEVQEKCKRLGLGLNVHYSRSQSFVIIEDNKYCSIENMDMYNRYEIEEITQADFLALPEPLKVGDWGKVNNYPADLNDSITIFKIEGSNEDYYINKLKSGNGTGCVGYYKKDLCEKLTPEQIKILNLE